MRSEAVRVLVGDVLERLAELPAESVPCVVLDPFLGSGTTAAVARRLGRNAIGIELNPEYVELAWTRINAAQPPLPGMVMP